MEYIYTIIGACRMADVHQKELQKLCRVCGKRLSRNRVNFSCELLKDPLATTFGVMICDDSPDIHPNLMCHPCYSVIGRAKKAAESGRQFHHNVSLFNWTAHSPSQCEVCEHFKRVSAGGRPKKMVSLGRPSSVSYRAAIEHIRSVAPPSFSPTPSASSGVVSTDVCPDLLCSLCSHLLAQPVHLTTCNNLVCKACLCRHLEESRELVCPCCNTDHLKEFSSIIPPSSVVITILGNQTITCTLCKNKITAGIIILYMCITHA